MKLKLKLLLMMLFFGFTSHAEDLTLVPHTVVDELRVDGVPVEWKEPIKALGVFLPGDEMDTTKLARSKSRIVDFLENKGYPNAQLDSELSPKVEEGQKKNILLFHVKLGVPIRILELNFAAQNGELTNDQFQKLRTAVDFKVGEPFDRDRVKEMRRAVESTLAAMNFVDSRVSKFDTAAEKTGVKVTFEIELGQRVVFSVQGNSFFARTELMTIIEEQRVVGLGRDYVSVLMGLLRDRYMAYGFRSISITPYSFEPTKDEPRKILFAIKEGPRAQIKQLLFDGNEAFTDEELENYYFKNASERIQTRVYNEKMAEDAAKSMIEEIKRKGYLSAKLIAFKTEDLDDQGSLALHIFVSEGLQTKIQKIEFHGQTLLSSAQLTELLGLHEGSPLNLVQLEDGIERMKREYRNRGYLNILISNEASNQIVTYSEKNQIAELSFELFEGPQFRLSETRVFGNEKTSRYVILREVQVNTDEVLSEKKILETEDRLRRLGIFSQVAVELLEDPTDPLKKVLKITVQEGVPGNVGFGAGFRNDLGIRLFGDITYSNLWGQNQTWVLNASGNRRLDSYQFVEYSGQMSYVWPWVFLGETVFRPSIHIEKQQFIEFDAQTFGFNASLERSIWKRIGLATGLTYSLEQIRQFNATNAIDNQQIRIGAITPLLKIDLRDNPLIPRRGLYAVTSFEYANTELGSQKEPFPVSYGRYQVRADWYIDYIPRVVWYTSVRGGWVKNFSNIYPNGVADPRISVPLIKQFALGGVNSLRGFVLEEINVQNQIVQDYSTFTNYRTQFDYFVTSNLSVGPFLDAGNLNINEFSLGNLRYGTGVGLRYITPVGPVNFDWGFKLFPRPGEQPSVFYFSLGVI